MLYNDFLLSRQENLTSLTFLILAEFQRAVKISTGFTFEPNMVGLIFRIFDADNDQHL